MTTTQSHMTISEAVDQQAWDQFLSQQQFSPFLQSWTMGEVYRSIGQEPIRLEVRENDEIQAICQAVVVPARRGRHLAIQYGPVINSSISQFLNISIDELYLLILSQFSDIAKQYKCSFIRMSPFLPLKSDAGSSFASLQGSRSSPLHLLAEHVWYLPLTEPNAWKSNHTKKCKPVNQLTSEPVNHPESQNSKDSIFMGMRKNTRNLIRRAEKEGVSIRKSTDTEKDMEAFIALHEETRKRHGFTPYSNRFFREQIEQFSEQKMCTLYCADYNGEVIASSVHMHCGGETSYHHGASTHKYPKIPASYLLQWTAICDALDRGDTIYNFWGIAPEGASNHPFRGVTTFKTGFGGELLELAHCRDLPLNASYHLTRGFELLRKWKRGF